LWGNSTITFKSSSKMIKSWIFTALILLHVLTQGSRQTFQLSSQVASERFDFTSQNKFSLARLFLHNLILCSICLIFSPVTYCEHASLLNLKSEELECWLFFPAVKDPHTRNSKFYLPSGQIPKRNVIHASLFHFGKIMTNNSNS